MLYFWRLEVRWQKAEGRRQKLEVRKKNIEHRVEKKYETTNYTFLNHFFTCEL